MFESPRKLEQAGYQRAKQLKKTAYWRRRGTEGQNWSKKPRIAGANGVQKGKTGQKNPACRSRRGIGEQNGQKNPAYQTRPSIVEKLSGTFPEK